jgi:hypothetical protein
MTFFLCCVHERFITTRTYREELASHLLSSLAREDLLKIGHRLKVYGINKPSLMICMQCALKIPKYAFMICDYYLKYFRKVIKQNEYLQITHYDKMKSYIFQYYLQLSSINDLFYLCYIRMTFRRHKCCRCIHKARW